MVPAGDLSVVPVPPTIHALLAARLDRLSAEEPAVIQRASVVGKASFRGAVAALSPEPERPAVGGHLLALVRKELVRPDRSSLPGEDAFRFRHLLIRDAAYESILAEMLVRVVAEPEGIAEAATRVADEVIPVFEELGDELGLARAWRLRSTTPWLLCRFAEMERYAERALEHARRAGSAGEEIASWPSRSSRSAPSGSPARGPRARRAPSRRARHRCARRRSSGCPSGPAPRSGSPPR